MRELVVVYTEYEQQVHIANQHGRKTGGRRELVCSATEIVVADGFFEGKPWVNLSEGELMQGCKRFRWR